MTKKPTNLIATKSKSLLALEYALLVFCLGVIALRTVYTEGPAVQTSTLPGNIGDNLYSLSVSAGLILAFALWLIWGLCSKNFVYRITGIEIGLIIFCAAAVVSGSAAADKRLAITNIVVTLAPLLCAVLLVQILDSWEKIMLVLAAIACLGVLSAYQGLDQLITTNKVTIEQYQQNPQSLLEPFGIEPDTLEQFLFEHRLYSQNLRASFTTRNSAASFLLISYFSAVALAVGRIRNRKSDRPNHRKYHVSDILIIILLLAVILTKSKGAIIGLFFSMVLYALYLALGAWLKAHRKTVLTVCVLLSIAGGTSIVWYGLKHDRLPGGSSMLVRWQYWRASAQMYAENPITGIGPGNFAYFYHHYKPAAALENVSDPHNFLLSILIQYGPLGLLGFAAMIVIPLWKVILPRAVGQPTTSRKDRPEFISKPVIFVLVLWLGVLLARTLLGPAVETGDLAVVIYVIIRFYLPPLLVFTISFLVLTKLPGLMRDMKKQKQDTNPAVAVLFCALLGVMLHNLTDFAIFEPGVYTTFWAVIACLIAIASHVHPSRQFTLKSALFTKSLVTGSVILISFVFFNYAFLPVARATAGIEKANQAISLGQFDKAHDLLDSAVIQDNLSAAAPSLNARLYIHQSELQPEKSREMLIQSQQYLETAIERNQADYQNFERLSEVYCLLSEISTGQEKTNWLEQAFDAAAEAVGRYPGCGRLHFKLAQIADMMNKADIAVEQYKQTIDIEQQYRHQFTIIYPDRQEIISRLGEDKYNFAFQRVKELDEKSDID